jgi:hypothetical protein
MSNQLAVTPGTVSVPQYVADGYSGSGSNRTLTFSGGAPPTDGSIALAFIVIDVNSTGLTYVDNAFQRLAYWADASSGKAAVTGVSGISTVSITAWSFLADAS